MLLLQETDEVLEENISCDKKGAFLRSRGAYFTADSWEFSPGQEMTSVSVYLRSKLKKTSFSALLNFHRVQ